MNRIYHFVIICCPQNRDKESIHPYYWRKCYLEFASVHDFKEKLDILNTVQLTTYECNCLQDLYDILKPFQVATDMVQGEKAVTASLVIPCIQWTKTETVRHIVKIQLDKWFSALEDCSVYIVASTLDPCFKLVQ